MQHEHSYFIINIFISLLHFISFILLLQPYFNIKTYNKEIDTFRAIELL